jgi:uncharacterized protein (DUF486 family)
MKAVLLLICSNIFMTFAWYGHLRWFPEHKGSQQSFFPLKIILISWGIAFLEYCFQVPGNRIGFADGMTAGQLKIMQEVITLAVFTCFSLLFLKEPLTWRYGGACLLMIGAVALVFTGKT